MILDNRIIIGLFKQLLETYRGKTGVDWNGGRQTPAGTARAENPLLPGHVTVKVSWSRARGKRPPAMEINGLYEKVKRKCQLMN